MQARLKLAFALSSLLLAACNSSSNSPRAVPAPPALNLDGTPVTAVITARFDPATSTVPFPINLLLSGTKDLTLNIPVANPNNFGDPTVALNALDGFSTTAPFRFQTSAAPRANSLVPGSSIRVFEVTLSGPGGGVTGVVRELAATEFVVAQAPSDTSGRTVAIIPTVPLKQVTSYLVVVTNGVKDAAGNDATPDTTYFLTQRTSPLCVDGQSTDPLIPAANACALEPLRKLTNAAEAAAASKGIPKSTIVLTWTFTTQSITPVLQAVRAKVGASPAPPTTLAFSGLNTGQIGLGLPPVADIYIGVISLPYYLQAPSAQAPTATLTGFWKAAPGAYVPPFNTFGLDPTSTNLTFANPVPVQQSTQTVPVLMTVPNANSGCTKPEAGWPSVIFNHGITRSRKDMLAISATMAAAGKNAFNRCFAVIAIDQPLHGITNKADPLYIENTPFGPAATERTFDLDLTNNTSGAPGPDGNIDGSGSTYINLSSLLTSRDNLRETVADLFSLTKAIPAMNIDANAATTDFDGASIGFVGQSLGAITGTPFMALEPTVLTGVLNVPGGQVVYLLNGSPTFGPVIRNGLAAAGVQAGTPAFDQFLGAAQTVVDSADPINYAAFTAPKRILAQLIVGNGSTNLPDQVVPPLVAGRPAGRRRAAGEVHEPEPDRRDDAERHRHTRRRPLHRGLARLAARSDFVAGGHRRDAGRDGDDALLERHPGGRPEHLRHSHAVSQT
jgi:hypothetical protein